MSDISNAGARTLADIVHIARRVQSHVFGHASYVDMRALLERSCLSDHDVQRILGGMVEEIMPVLLLLPFRLLVKSHFM